MPLPETLRKLLTAPGPSGYEQAPAAVFRDAAAAFAEITYDSVGSSVARVRGTGDGPFVAVVGHIDEIGLIVHHIDDDGFLWFTGVGGWDPVILVGQRVEVSTREGRVPGVVGKKPIHLLKDEERKKAPELKNLHIDIGARDGDDARSMVRIGDVAVIAGEPVELPNDRVISRSMDNRLGCYVAFEAARLVAEAGDAPGDVAAVAVAQEEISFGGARTTAYTLRPDIAVVVDVTFATDAPGGDEKETGRHKFGSGPVLTRGSTLDPAVFELLHAAGEAEGIPFTLAASARVDRHRRRRLPHLARRHSVGGRVGAAALHALAGGDGPAGRRRERRQADRGLRAPARAGSGPEALTLLVLFDVDGTLLRAGATEHGRALREAAEHVHGIPSLDGVLVELAGRTDANIVRDMLAAAGIPGEAADARWAEVQAAAMENYERLCPDDLSDRVLPGIVELLEALAGRPDEFRLSLVTGNLEPLARLKLDRAGLGRFFEPGQGGFASDHASRAELPRIARERAGGWPRERTVVIGDTPRDIACARADGVRVAAVATGPFAIEALADADAVVDDARALLPVLEDFLKTA